MLSELRLIEPYPLQNNFILPFQVQSLHDPLFHKLDYSDQTEFSKVVTYFQLADDRNKRNFGMSTFIKHLNIIHHYVVTGKSQTQKHWNQKDGLKSLPEPKGLKNRSAYVLRGLSCGILFGNGFLLVNTDKLKRITRRSKSCVNGCFQKLGFGVSRISPDFNGFFAEILQDCITGQQTTAFQNSTIHQWVNPRQWCIRKASSNAPICFISVLSDELSTKYGFPIDSYQKVDGDIQNLTEKNSTPISHLGNHNQNKDDTENKTKASSQFLFDINSLLNPPHSLHLNMV